MSFPSFPRRGESITLVLLLTLISARAVAQNTSVFGLFPTIDHTGRFADRWSYSLYYFGAYDHFSNRLTDVTAPAWGAFYSEQALHYNAGKYLTLSGSYVYERQNPLLDSYRNENRFYLQATVRYKVGINEVRQRLRYDGRYITNRKSGTTPFTSRLRYLTGIICPINSPTQTYFSVYNEFFLNLDKNISPVYGENWAFAGVGLPTSKYGTWEAGPLYIFWVKPGFRNDLINFLYLQLSWTTNLDLTTTHD